MSYRDWYAENQIDINDSLGIDEAGRGPLAGPVVTAAVWISSAAVSLLEDSKLVVRDSKKMTQNQRRKVADWLHLLDSTLVRYSIASAAVEEIDSLNILNATLRAMEKSYNALEISEKFVLVDGNRAPNMKNCKEVKTIVDGDNKVLSISLASIIAKEYRDDIMKKLAQEYPAYGWEANVGYGSKKHIDAILEHGLTSHHRKTFCHFNLPLQIDASARR